jgi:hypothetical protein
MMMFFGQAVVILVFMAKVTTSLQECQSVLISTVGAQKDRNIRDAEELQRLAELVQVTAPSLTIFGQPITPSFVQGLVLYTPTVALLIYGAIN